MKKNNLSFIVPFVGGIDDDTNYFSGNKFYWLPITEDYPGDKTYLIKDIKFKNVRGLPSDILEDVKDRKFHFDPLLLNAKTSSYGEPISSKKKKDRKVMAMKKFFGSSLNKNGKCLKNVNAKIFFGAKFQDYDGTEYNSTTTGLFIIGGIKIEYAGERDILIKNFPKLRKIINQNAHQRRRNPKNFFIVIGKGFLYNKPIKFAEWKPYYRNNKRVKSYLLKESFRNGTPSGRVMTSVHVCKFDKRDISKDLVK